MPRYSVEGRRPVRLRIPIFGGRRMTARAEEIWPARLVVLRASDWHIET